MIVADLLNAKGTDVISIAFGRAEKQQTSAFVIAHPAFGEEHHDRSPQPVADGMELGVQTTFGAPAKTEHR